MRRIRIEEGEVVRFTANTGRSWSAVVVKPPVVQIQLEGDPFPLDVLLSEVACKRNPRRVSSQSISPRRTRRRPDDMATATPSEAKELRTRARELGIDYKNMTRVELRKAIKSAEEKASAKASGSKPTTKDKTKPASKSKASTTKPKGKAAAQEATEAEADAQAKASRSKKGGKHSKSAKKAAKPKGDGAEPVEKKRPGRKPIDRSSIEPGTCPFTKGSDRAVVFQLLKKGGNRRKLAEALREKVTLRGEPGINDYDKRLTLIADTLEREWGYTVQKSGRGLEGKIKVVHPNQSKGKK